ncbi:hypothetical protein TcasGA2_TC033383 [Tribolium castaneum]|uniref:Uncharacterized protein n=1 Tax=Tribolium castaneum TaxID=7070 RepID=A0A139WGM6_TRICA|nr:hypothetical protein TcasGA2_TC033383 [Tribolium castaneum]
MLGFLASNFCKGKGRPVDSAYFCNGPGEAICPLIQQKIV